MLRFHIEAALQREQQELCSILGLNDVPNELKVRLLLRFQRIVVLHFAVVSLAYLLNCINDFLARANVRRPALFVCRLLEIWSWLLVDELFVSCWLAVRRYHGVVQHIDCAYIIYWD